MTSPARTSPPPSSVAAGAPPWSGTKADGTARLEVSGAAYELPVIIGTEGERAIDIAKLRAQTGLITLD